MELNAIAVEIIYEYPEKSTISFNNIKNNNKLRSLATSEVKKIIKFVGQGIIDDEDLKDH